MSSDVFMPRRSLIVLLIGAGAMSGALAHSPSGPDIDGSVRTGIWSHTRNLDEVGPDSATSLWLHGTENFGQGKAIVADGWAQSVDSDSNDQGGNIHGAYLRELYFKANLGDVDLRLGRQLIVWGRADEFNPTDNIGARDFTLLTTDDAEQRKGTDAAAVTYFVNPEYSLQIIWVPFFRGDVIPFQVQPMQMNSVIEPERRSQYAVKLDHSGGSVDWSLSYFDGYDLMPDLSLTGISSAGVQTALTNNKVKVIGADFSSNFEFGILRGEIAWSQRDNSGADEEGFFRKRSQLLAVVGGDKNFDDSLNVNLQLFGQLIPDYRSPDQLTDPIERAVAIGQAAINNQTGRSQYGFTYRMAKDWMNDTWQAELSGVYSITTNENFTRAQLKHTFSDKWRLIAGVEKYRGDEDTFFGQLRRNSTAYAELRYVF
jgi:hypothetical protein